MSRSAFTEIQRDPSSLYLHSTIGQALTKTISTLRNSPEFAFLTPLQKETIANSMIQSMKKEDIFSKTIAKQEEVNSSPQSGKPISTAAARYQASLSSLEVKGNLKEYSIVGGTMRLTLEKAQITVNTYEAISVASDDLPLTIIATETKCANRRRKM